MMMMMMMMMMRSRGAAEQECRFLCQLLTMLFNALRCPPTAPTLYWPERTRVSGRRQVSPAAFASLLLGVSTALMLCGSLRFVIGFFLMPWVLGFVILLYLVGLVSNLSGFRRITRLPKAVSNSFRR